MEVWFNSRISRAWHIVIPLDLEIYGLFKTSIVREWSVDVFEVVVGGY